MTQSPTRKILITGASGFLGSEIVAAARNHGWSVRAFDRNHGSHPDDVEAVIGDLKNYDSLRNACEGVSAIVHAAGLAHLFGRAAKDAACFDEVNEQGTACVAKAAAETGVRNMVLVSSVSVYGSYAGDSCNEDRPCHPTSPYAVSKWKGERQAILQASASACSLSILRFATIYGEGDRGNVARLIRSLQRGRFVWPGRGLNRKSLIYKTDAALACVRALNCPSPGVRTFNVSSSPANMREIVSAICDSLRRPVPRLTIPLPVITAAAACSRILGDPADLSGKLAKFIRDDVYDASRFNSVFQFQPGTPLVEGLRLEVEYLLSLDKTSGTRPLALQESSVMSEKRVRP